MKNCPFCGEKNAEAAAVCEHCGSDLDKQDTVKKPCPYCGAPITVFSETCRSCGRSYRMPADGLASPVLESMFEEPEKADQSRMTLRRLLILSGIVLIVLCFVIAGLVIVLNVFFPTT